jgi:hypothetical protein
MKSLMFVMLLALLMGGCFGKKTYVHEEWVKNGVTLVQQQKDYLECRGLFYIKPGTTSEEYLNDLGFCMEAGLARDKHKHIAGTAIGLAAPVVGVGAIIAQIVIEAQKDYCVRCMEKKGYQKNPQPFSGSQINECMTAKGYEWKEVTETK